jgi:hypothetical protein
LTREGSSTSAVVISGHFLVEACRFLADRVLAAWTRERKVEAIAAEHGDPLLHARRLAARRCLYGVDKNAAAVELAKLSLSTGRSSFRRCFTRGCRIRSMRIR